MLFETLLVEQRGPVTLLTLNRPHVLNALNDQVLRDLSAAFAAYSADDSQRCAVLTGSARAFAAGADLTEVATKAASADRKSVGEGQRVSDRVDLGGRGIHKKKQKQ